MTTPHEQFDECNSNFVSYRWFSVSLVSLIISILAISVAAAVRFTSIDERSLNNKERIEKVEDTVNRKLDIIIEEIRKSK